MKTKAAEPEMRLATNYVIVIVTVTLLAALSWSMFVGRNLRLDGGRYIACLIGGCVVGLITVWLSLRSFTVLIRKVVVPLAVAGAVLSAIVYGWTLHAAKFQLTAASYPALNSAHVPADLMADLKSAEAITDDTDQQFVDDLSTKLGQDHIAPYRDALIHSCWNCHRRLALAASAGLCACFSLGLCCWAASRLTASDDRRLFGVSI